jgi:hypothetical protein
LISIVLPKFLCTCESWSYIFLWLISLNISRTEAWIENQGHSVKGREIGSSIVLVKYSMCNIKPYEELFTLIIFFLLELSLYYI